MYYDVGEVEVTTTRKSPCYYFVGPPMIWNITKSTHSMEIIWTLAWLSPRHALDIYKVDLLLLHALVSPSPSGLSSANPGGLLWSVSCFKLLIFSVPFICFPYSSVKILVVRLLTALSRCWFMGYLKNSGDYWSRHATRPSKTYQLCLLWRRLSVSC